MSEVLQLITGLMRKIDEIPCHPKNKLLLYHRFVLSKISWHFTIAGLGKTWVAENIDNLVSKYICQWLELPICATLGTLVLSKSKYGISLILPSTKFAQCQVVMRSTLKLSPSTDINALWSLTSSGCNIQYDQYRNIKQVSTAIQNVKEVRIRHELKSLGFILSSILIHGSKHNRHLWTKVHCNMPRNIFNFILFLQRRIYANGPSLPNLYALLAYSLRLFNMLCPVANPIFKMVDTPGIIIASF